MDDNQFLNTYKKKLGEPDAKPDQPETGADQPDHQGLTLRRKARVCRTAPG